MVWCPQSHDLNIMDSVWGWIQRWNMGGLNNLPALEEYTEKCWIKSLAFSFFVLLVCLSVGVFLIYFYVRIFLTVPDQKCCPCRQSLISFSLLTQITLLFKNYLKTHQWVTIFLDDMFFHYHKYWHRCVDYFESLPHTRPCCWKHSQH